MGTKLNREKCLKRSRVAARRDGVNGARMKFLREVPKAETCAKAIGTLPRSMNEAMKLINANTKEPLKQEDVYIHYAEAANDNFLDDRYMFMHETTLRNIAKAASAGIAFMNSHATGGLSSPAELPYGRTFAGRYEEVIQSDGSVRRRALFGFYMLRGVQPNGANGPSTDDLDAAIKGGTLFDVSVGLYGGQAVCDVCGEDLESECGHIPGTTHGMEDGEIEAQIARGVPEGRASYTYVGGKCHEVSAVYEGAVPGAGFTKALQNLRRLTDEERAELAESFRSLITGLKTYGDAMTHEDLEGKPPIEEEEEEDEVAAEMPAEMPDEKEEEEKDEGGEAPVEGDEGEPEDEEGDEEMVDESDDEREEEDEGAASIHARVESLLKLVGDAKVAEFRAAYARRFTPSQLDAMSAVVRKVSVSEPIYLGDLEKFFAASPDLEATFGRQPHVPAKLEEAAPSRRVADIADEVASRLAARGITLQNTPSPIYNREYAKETNAVYAQMAGK